jgi:hypothetical protein
MEALSKLPTDAVHVITELFTPFCIPRGSVSFMLSFHNLLKVEVDSAAHTSNTPFVGFLLNIVQYVQTNTYTSEGLRFCLYMSHIAPYVRHEREKIFVGKPEGKRTRSRCR